MAASGWREWRRNKENGESGVGIIVKNGVASGMAAKRKSGNGENYRETERKHRKHRRGS